MTKLLLPLLVVSLSGCATVQLATDRVDRTQASIASAERGGANDVAAARIHLEFAKQQTEAAQRLAAEGDDRAPELLARAESDAELAVALTAEATVYAQSIRAASDLEALRARPAP